jgi:hypothetical protein
VTRISLNGQQFDQLNRHLTVRNDTLLRIRVPVPKGLLRPGVNQLRLEQGGTEEDPDRLDNFGLSCVAIEYSATSGPRGADLP